MLLSDVIRWGTDSSGRGIYMTRYMAEWVDDFIEECENHGFTPTITQGAWMVKNGGGAPDSMGYHDKGKCIDWRIYDLTADQQGFLIRESRRRAGASWLRGPKYGQNMEIHCHMTIGPDRGEATQGAVTSWHEYVAGGDGLVGSAPDYHWRPDPLVTNWEIPPKPTPAITKALAAKGIEARKRALRRIVNHSDLPRARRAAQVWLNSILAIEAAKKKASAAKKTLKELERV